MKIIILSRLLRYMHIRKKQYKIDMKSLKYANEKVQISFKIRKWYD